jgi:mono/diheme cytochrome c family protein
MFCVSRDSEDLMNMHKGVLRSIFLSYVLIVCSAADVSAAESASSDTHGRELYLTYQCWQCHGYEGQGGGAARISSKAYTFDIFARFVRHPNVMPAYPPQLLSDEELRLIYEYIRSIDAPPLLQDIPELQSVLEK